MHEISFTTTREEMDLIGKIADRAERLGMVGQSHWYTHQTAVMDLCATHANGTPLDFAGLLEAPDFDFAHDIAGIANHIDRETGRLGSCFLPRCAKREG